MVNNFSSTIKAQTHALNKSEVLWHGILNSKTVNILVAEQSTGKSMFAINLIKNLIKHNTRSVTLLERPIITKKIKCLYITTEMNEELLIERFNAIGINNKIKNIDKYLFIDYQQVVTPELIREDIEKTGAEFIVIDVLFGLIKGLNKDLNSYYDMNDLAGTLRTLFPNQTFLLIHHMNKAKKTMGSVGTLSAMDTRIEMTAQYTETVNDETLIYQNLSVYGKSVSRQDFNIVFQYPYFSLIEDIEEDELDKPLSRLIEYVIENADINHNGKKIVGTYQQVAAKVKMIEKYRWSPKRFGSLLSQNKQVLTDNNIFYDIVDTRTGYELSIWYDDSENTDDVKGDEIECMQ